MKQKKFNELDAKLKSARSRFADAVLKECKLAGLNAKDPIQRAAIKQLASVDYELVMAMLQDSTEAK